MITNYSYNNMKVMVNRVNQKNIKIIINDNYIKKYYIKIYDTNNNLIYENIIFDNYFYFTGIINNYYKLVIESETNKLITSFYITDKCECNTYNININYRVPYTITFILTDSIYTNLRITEGEIYLWQL